MTAANQLPANAPSAARELLAAHGAAPQDADQYASVLETAGLLISPQAAEDMLATCHVQARDEPSPADVAVMTEERDALRRVVGRWLHQARRHWPGWLDPADMASELEELAIDIDDELHGAALVCDACDEVFLIGS